MNQDNPFNTEITSVDEFESMLGQIVTAAARNGIDPQGSWEVRNGDEIPDWEAMIIELEKPDFIE